MSVVCAMRVSLAGTVHMCSHRYTRAVRCTRVRGQSLCSRTAGWKVYGAGRYPQSQQKPRNQQRTHTHSRQQARNQRKNVIPQMLSTLETIFESLPPHLSFPLVKNCTEHLCSPLPFCYLTLYYYSCTLFMSPPDASRSMSVARVSASNASCVNRMCSIRVDAFLMSGEMFVDSVLAAVANSFMSLILSCPASSCSPLRGFLPPFLPRRLGQREVM